MIGACFLGDIAATTVKIQFVRAVALRELGLRRYCSAKNYSSPTSAVAASRVANPSSPLWIMWPMNSILSSSSIIVWRMREGTNLTLSEWCSRESRFSRTRTITVFQHRAQLRLDADCRCWRVGALAASCCRGWQVSIALCRRGNPFPRGFRGVLGDPRLQDPPLLLGVQRWSRGAPILIP